MKARESAQRSNNRGRKRGPPTNSKNGFRVTQAAGLEQGEKKYGRYNWRRCKAKEAFPASVWRMCRPPPTPAPSVPGLAVYKDLASLVVPLLDEGHAAIIVCQFGFLVVLAASANEAAPKASAHARRVKHNSHYVHANTNLPHPFGPGISRER